MMDFGNVRGNVYNRCGFFYMSIDMVDFYFFYFEWLDD